MQESCFVHVDGTPDEGCTPWICPAQHAIEGVSAKESKNAQSCTRPNIHNSAKKQTRRQTPREDRTQHAPGKSNAHTAKQGKNITDHIINTDIASGGGQKQERTQANRKTKQNETNTPYNKKGARHPVNNSRHDTTSKDTAVYLRLQRGRHGLALVEDVLNLAQAPLASYRVRLKLCVRSLGALQLHFEAVRPGVAGLSLGFLWERGTIIILEWGRLVRVRA